MKYIKLVIAIDDDYQEPLIAELNELDFDAFEQQRNKVITYIPKERFNDINREQIEQILAVYPGEGHIQSEEVVADQNWNEEWEKTIRAQHIGLFFVRPTWSREQPGEHAILLEIDPKMSFGTGYHETTRLMLKALPEVIRKQDVVLDAGTGTGILAIAAVKLGAQQVFAFDIDQWSIDNIRENILLNEVSSRVTVKWGSEETLPESAHYDAILANIERNTIQEMLPVFAEVLAENGKMLLSGLLETDKKSVLESLEKLGFKAEKMYKENEWIALQVSNINSK